MVLSMSSCLSDSNSHRFSGCFVNDDLAMARYSMVLEDAFSRAAPATVCRNLDGPSKPFRMDVQATRKHRLFVSEGNEFRCG